MGELRGRSPSGDENKRDKTRWAFDGSHSHSHLHLGPLIIRDANARFIFARFIYPSCSRKHWSGRLIKRARNMHNDSWGSINLPLRSHFWRWRYIHAPIYNHHTLFGCCQHYPESGRVQKRSGNQANRQIILIFIYKSKLILSLIYVKVTLK